MRNERIAPEGFWLTQATLNEDEQRIFVKKVCGFADLDTVFILFSDSEKVQWEDGHKEQLNDLEDE